MTRGSATVQCQAVNKALKDFGHEKPDLLQDQPYPYIPWNYGATNQYAADPDNFHLLNEAYK